MDQTRCYSLRELRVIDIEERIPLESENDHVAIISAKLNVLEPGTKSFKKKLTTLSRNALLWQKSLKERPQHLFLRKFDAKCFSSLFLVKF